MFYIGYIGDYWRGHDRAYCIFELYFIFGADDGTRTCDLCFTKALLYQLSYIGLKVKGFTSLGWAFFYHKI